MSRYILIETRNPFESADVPHYYALATRLADQGNDVTLFLIQNGVLAARRAIPDNPLQALVGPNVTILADDFSLRERAVTDAERRENVQPAAIERLVDLIMDTDATKVMWH